MVNENQIPTNCPNCGAPIVNGACQSCNWVATQTQNQTQQPYYYQQTVPGAPGQTQQPYGQGQPGQNQYQYAQQPYGAPQTNVYVNQMQQPQNYKYINKVAYILITWFLGVIGVHRFVRGQVGLGILYIFTVGGFGIAVLVDFIISLTKLSNYSGVENYEFTISPRGHWTR